MRKVYIYPGRQEGDGDGGMRRRISGPGVTQAHQTDYLLLYKYVWYLKSLKEQTTAASPVIRALGLIDEVQFANRATEKKPSAFRW